MSAVMPANATSPSTAAPGATPAPVARPLVRDPAKPLDVDEALQRLARSREDLRHAMLPAAASPGAPLMRSSGVAGIATQLTARVSTLPGANVIMDAIRIWWAKHPLNMVGRVAAEAARRYTAPVAERNPVGLILGAVAAGALLALTRPWRWLLRPALFAGLLPAIGVRLLKEIPAETLLRAYSSTRGRATTRTTTAPVTGSRPSAASSSAPTASVASSAAPIRQTATLP